MMMIFNNNGFGSIFSPLVTHSLPAHFLNQVEQSSHPPMSVAEFLCIRPGVKEAVQWRHIGSILASILLKSAMMKPCVVQKHKMIIN